MSDLRLSAEAGRQLAEAGWSGTRSVDIAHYRAALEAEGYELHAHASSFLRSFGGLRLVAPGDQHFHFNAADAARSGSPDWVVETYAKRVGEPLCAIGEAFNGHLVLAMSPTGRVFGGYDDELILIGNDESEAWCVRGVGGGVLPREVQVRRLTEGREPLVLLRELSGELLSPPEGRGGGDLAGG